jgi:hypothetical protein
MRLFDFFRRTTKLRAECDMYQRAERQMFRTMLMMADRAYDRRCALREIAACETPGANATVRRMAKIARDALEATSDPTDVIGEPWSVT